MNDEPQSYGKNLHTPNNCESKLVIKTLPVTQYQGNLNKQSDPTKGLYVLSEYKNSQISMPIKILLDSGCSKSLIDINTLNQMPSAMKPIITENHKQVRFADKSLQQSLGTVVLPLQIGNKNIQASFIVGKFSDPILLGLDLIHAIKHRFSKYVCDD